tara:strand:+ start:3510 stop:4709 length:1200 start_codon:yes stop_codon:yes gene_type:complete
MDDLERLLDAFQNKTLLKPDFSRPNFMNLVDAISVITGANNNKLSANGMKIKKEIGDPQHLIFILADGVGNSSLEGALDSSNWLLKNHVQTLESIYPSTTSAALTSLGTGLWPSEHSITGWWNFIPILGSPITVLPFRTLDNKRSLQKDLNFADVIMHESLMSKMSRQTFVVQPHSIHSSMYSNFIGAGATHLPYHNLNEAIDLITSNVLKTHSTSYTYWYISEADHQAHKTGTDSLQTQMTIRDIDKAITGLRSKLNADTTKIVFSSDHGHRKAKTKYTINKKDPINWYLSSPPSGDLRISFYHVRKEFEDDFKKEFSARFGKDFVLIPSIQLNNLRLFGPNELSKETLSRVGTFTAISLGEAVLRYIDSDVNDYFMKQESQHSGLSVDEMTIPLAIG